jgi:hypothetical protein
MSSQHSFIFPISLPHSSYHAPQPFCPPPHNCVYPPTSYISYHNPPPAAVYSVPPTHYQQPNNIYFHPYVSMNPSLNTQTRNIHTSPVYYSIKLSSTNNTYNSSSFSHNETNNRNGEDKVKINLKDNIMKLKRITLPPLTVYSSPSYKIDSHYPQETCVQPSTKDKKVHLSHSLNSHIECRQIIENNTALQEAEASSVNKMKGTKRKKDYDHENEDEIPNIKYCLVYNNEPFSEPFHSTISYHSRILYRDSTQLRIFQPRGLLSFDVPVSLRKQTKRIQKILPFLPSHSTEFHLRLPIRYYEETSQQDVTIGRNGENDLPPQNSPSSSIEPSTTLFISAIDLCKLLDIRRNNTGNFFAKFPRELVAVTTLNMETDSAVISDTLCNKVEKSEEQEKRNRLILISLNGALHLLHHSLSHISKLLMKPFTEFAVSMGFVWPNLPQYPTEYNSTIGILAIEQVVNNPSGATSISSCKVYIDRKGKYIRKRNKIPWKNYRILRKNEEE